MKYNEEEYAVGFEEPFLDMIVGGYEAKQSEKGRQEWSIVKWLKV